MDKTRATDDFAITGAITGVTLGVFVRRRLGSASVWLQGRRSEGLRWTYDWLPRPARPVPVLCHLWLAYRGAGSICETWGRMAADGA
jgi:hypothetical protein